MADESTSDYRIACADCREVYLISPDGVEWANVATQTQHDHHPGIFTTPALAMRLVSEFFTSPGWYCTLCGRRTGDSMETHSCPLAPRHTTLQEWRDG